MSSGPEERKLNPRSGRSSCIEDTPRSKNTPSAALTDALDAVAPDDLAGRIRAALEDLTRYLELVPQAADRSAVQATVRYLEMRISPMN